MKIPILDSNLCIEKYNHTVDGRMNIPYSPYIVDKSQICAGHLEGGIDVCRVSLHCDTVMI